MSSTPVESQETQGQQPQPAAKPAVFTPPATQEDFDRIIADRLSRERAKYGDYDDLKTKAAEYDKAQEAAKTELQKAVERAEAAEKKAAGYESEKQIADWAKDITKGQTAIPASALRGSTKEDLQAHFDQLKSLIPEPRKGAIGPYVPGEGTNPTGNLGGPAQEFADYLTAQLGR